MDATHKVPDVAHEKYRRTKIIARVSSSIDSYESVLELVKSGANGLILDFSQGTHEEHECQIKWIREAARECGQPAAIIQDLLGPRLRLGDFEGVIGIERGQNLQFAYNADYAKSGRIPLDYDLSKQLKRGERLLLFGGKVRANVTSVHESVVFATAENDGILIKHTAIHVPDTDFEGDVLTEEDKKDLAYGSARDVDYVLMNFAQTAGDVEHLHHTLKNLGSTAQIIVKIGTKNAVENLVSIVQAADAVMVDDNELVAEVPIEAVPTIKREIIGLGLKFAKPSIIATGVSGGSEPTMDEVSEIATGVLVGADCILVGEPLNAKEAVKAATRVIAYTESHAPCGLVFPDADERTYQNAVGNSIINLATDIEARAIVAETKSGATARQIASYRPGAPLITVTNHERTAQQLAIVYGTKNFVRSADHLTTSKLTDWLGHNRILVKGDVIVVASCQFPGVAGTADTIEVRVIE